MNDRSTIIPEGTVGRDTDGVRPELVVFSDDWGRHPSSCQHLVEHLLPRYRVYWVNTVGTRRPALDRYTLQRSLGKLREWARPAPAAAEHRNLAVLRPVMWPSFGSALARRVNAGLLSAAVARHLVRPGRGIAVTTVPVVSDLVSQLSVARWVYYCVDDLGAWPGLDGATLRRMERELVPRVDAVVAASPALAARMASLGRTAPVLTHGVDLEHWTRAADGPLPALAGLAAPFVVFWGVVDPRLDAGWLEALSERLGWGSILLVGPADRPPARLAALPNVHAVGPVAYRSLPALARAAAVLIMPYADLRVTRAMQPLKLKEYLATGKPVVVSALPAVAPWRDACDVADTADAFARLVCQRLDGVLPEAQRRARERLQRESWPAKARAFEDILLGGGA